MAVPGISDSLEENSTGMYGIIFEVLSSCKVVDLFGNYMASLQPRRQFINFVGSYMKGGDVVFHKNSGAGPYDVLLFSGKLWPEATCLRSGIKGGFESNPSH